MSGTKPPTFRPFADAATVQIIGGLSLENGRDRIAVHGSLDLTRDRGGLERARALQRAVNAIVEALAQADLSEAIGSVAEATQNSDQDSDTVKNPFT